MAPVTAQPDDQRPAASVGPLGADAITMASGWDDSARYWGGWLDYLAQEARPERLGEAEAALLADVLGPAMAVDRWLAELRRDVRALLMSGAPPDGRCRQAVELLAEVAGAVLLAELREVAAGGEAFGRGPERPVPPG